MLALPSVAQRTAPHDKTLQGHWDPPFQHPLGDFTAPPAFFNALHLSLIPVGPLRGQIFAFDLNEDQTGTDWLQRYAVIDVSGPGAPTFENAELPMPTNGGDLFCAGHAWMSDGCLFIAGGTTEYPGAGPGLHPGQFLGGRLAYVWDPRVGPAGTWHRQPDMKLDRWYPTVTLLPDSSLLVTGGVPNTEDYTPHDNYQVFEPGPSGGIGQWEINQIDTLFSGPGGYAAFTIYPRIHLLFSGHQYASGMGTATARLNHAAAPGEWTTTANSAYTFRNYGTSVLLPNIPGLQEDVVLRLGGYAWDKGPIGVVASAELVHAAADSSPSWDWQPAASMKRPRMHPCAVLLPTGDVLVVGGRTNPTTMWPEEFALVPELYRPASDTWRDMAPGASARTYHSTALLLPDGRVLSAAGNTSTEDYQIFHPPYLFTGLPRPNITAAPEVLLYRTSQPRTYTAEFDALPAGDSVTRVVLIAPGSTTHHFDQSMRFIELEVVEATDTNITFQPPTNAAEAPVGYYMMFLVSEGGIPSVASWVHVERPRRDTSPLRLR